MSGYLEGLADAVLADHPVDFLLRGEFVGDVVEHEDVLLGARLDHQLVFVVVREVHVLGVPRFARLRLQSHHYLHLLLTVYAATAHSHHPNIINKPHLSSIHYQLFDYQLFHYGELWQLWIGWGVGMF